MSVLKSQPRQHISNTHLQYLYVSDQSVYTEFETICTKYVGIQKNHLNVVNETVLLSIQTHDLIING